MSQHWHAHWAEDSFKPRRLQNWEVPRWHPEWPVRHCTTTRFEAHKNGRIFTKFKNPNHVWSDFKGTWELPLKIDRKTAEELSKSTEYKKTIWNAHKIKHESYCAKICKEEKEIAIEKTVDSEEVKKSAENKSEINLKEDNSQKQNEITEKKCKVTKGCKL